MKKSICTGDSRSTAVEVFIEDVEPAPMILGYFVLRVFLSR